MSGDNRPNADELVKQYGKDWDLPGVYNHFCGELKNAQGGLHLNTNDEGKSPAVYCAEKPPPRPEFGPQGYWTWIPVTVDNPCVALINPLENKILWATGANEDVTTVPATRDNVRDKRGHWLMKYVKMPGDPEKGDLNKHYKFEHLRFKTYLEPADGNAAAGTPIRTSAPSNDNKQLWKFSEDHRWRPKGYGPRG